TREAWSAKRASSSSSRLLARNDATRSGSRTKGGHGSSDMLRRTPAQEQDEEHPAHCGDHDEARPARNREDPVRTAVENSTAPRMAPSWADRTLRCWVQ